MIETLTFMNKLEMRVISFDATCFHNGKHIFICCVCYSKLEKFLFIKERFFLNVAFVLQNLQQHFVKECWHMTFQTFFQIEYESYNISNDKKFYLHEQIAKQTLFLWNVDTWLFKHFSKLHMTVTIFAMKEIHTIRTNCKGINFFWSYLLCS